MSESMADTHSATPQPGSDEGAVLTTAGPSTSPADEKTDSRCGVNKIARLGRQLRSMKNAKILGRGNDRVARKTIEAWHTETTSINGCVALPSVYPALRMQLDELKSKRKVTPDVNPNTGEPTADLHVATSQIGPDEGAVINTVVSTTTPADGEKRGQRDAIKTRNPGRQLRST
nr:unnamed protein product [Spirometra erinaceieuropaei]